MIKFDAPSIHLGSVSPAEYPEVVAVWEASVRATHHFVTEEVIQLYRPLILDEYLWMMDLTCARNAEGRIVGFAGVSDGKLEMLFLHPSARGNGVGKRLLKHAVQQLKITKVDVNEENGQALGFYQHEGFTVVSRSEVDNMGMPHPILHMELISKPA